MMSLLLMTSSLMSSPVVFLFHRGGHWTWTFVVSSAPTRLRVQCRRLPSASARSQQEPECQWSYCWESWRSSDDFKKLLVLKSR